MWRECSKLWKRLGCVHRSLIFPKKTSLKKGITKKWKTFFTFFSLFVWCSLSPKFSFNLTRMQYGWICEMGVRLRLDLFEIYRANYNLMMVDLFILWEKLDFLFAELDLEKYIHINKTFKYLYRCWKSVANNFTVFDLILFSRSSGTSTSDITQLRHLNK